jgi:hypothetical protein
MWYNKPNSKQDATMDRNGKWVFAKGDYPKWKESENQVLKRLKIDVDTENISLQKYLKWLRDHENDYTDMHETAAVLLASYTVKQLEYAFEVTYTDIFIRN